MDDNMIHELPKKYPIILEKGRAMGFTMASDIKTGSILKTLVAAKPQGTFLELGTGTGLATTWMLDGMIGDATLISIENDAHLIAIAQKELGSHKALQLICTDAEPWLNACNDRFDLIFADTWAGKYLALDKTLSLLKTGGIYFIDDMLPQPNWPEGHDKKALDLIETLEKREDLTLTKLNWASGIVIAVKK